MHDKARHLLLVYEMGSNDGFSQLMGRNGGHRVESLFLILLVWHILKDVHCRFTSCQMCLNKPESQVECYISQHVTYNSVQIYCSWLQEWFIV